MADERPINSKPFSKTDSYAKSEQKNKTVSQPNDRLITGEIRLSPTPISTLAAPMPTNMSIDALLSGSMPARDFNQTLMPLPVTIDTNKLASIPSPEVNSLSKYISGDNKHLETNTVANNELVLGQNVSSSNVTDIEEVDVAIEPDHSSTLINFFNNLAPNQLNDYPQATYHLKLFMVKSELVLHRKGSIAEWQRLTPDIFSNENIVVIAESGVTAGIYIESFSVTDIVSMAPYFNSCGVTAKLSLKEPFGANFIDYYNGAITDLGYETRIQAPVFLEITFKGYDENGRYMPVNSIGSKIYRFTTTNIDADFDSGGTTYNIDFVVLSDIARQTAIANTSNNLTVQGKTVGDFIQRILEEWNKEGKDIEQDTSQPSDPTSGTTGAVPAKTTEESSDKPTETNETPTPTEKNEFEVIVDELCVEYKDCMTWEVGKASSPDRHRLANTVFEEGEGEGTIEATWGPGSDRVGIIYDIINSTKESQTLVVNGKKDDEIKPGSKELGGTSFLPEIDINVEFNDYNSETHTYNKKITYIIQERRTTQVASTPKEINDAEGNEQALLNKLPYVRRRYDYYGTGKNTEILNFNIKMNSNFMINLPAYSAQKRVSVADNPGTGSAEIQSKQVADGGKASSSQGVKLPTPTNPDEMTGGDGSGDNGSSTNDNVEMWDKAVAEAPTTMVAPIPVTAKPATKAEVDEAVFNLNKKRENVQANWANLSEAERNQAVIDIEDLKTDASKKLLSNMNEANAVQKQKTADSMAEIDQKLAAVANRSAPIDSVQKRTSPTSSSAVLNASPATGTLAYGANTQQVNNTVDDPVSRANTVSLLSGKYLEDFARIKSDSPKADVASYKAVISTDLNNHGGYNLDDSSGIGKSYVAALLGGLYGQFADMNKVMMEVRGDPLWLGVKNKATGDQLTSFRVGHDEVRIRDTDGNILPPSDHKVLLTVVFPTLVDENTGLAIPNKVSEGYTSLYNLLKIESVFESGKFIQKLELYQDQSTMQVRKYIDPMGSADI